jgi:hypothetical protein
VFAGCVDCPGCRPSCKLLWVAVSAVDNTVRWVLGNGAGLNNENLLKRGGGKSDWVGLL